MQRTIETILSYYESISDQKINYGKSKICLGKNIGLHESLRISTALNIRKVDQQGQYLGMPFVYGCNKTEAFRSFIEKYRRPQIGFIRFCLLQAKRSWSNPFFMRSQLTWCHALDSQCQSYRNSKDKLIDFWWGGEVGKNKKTHWIRKELPFKDKLDGGFGLKKGSRILRNLESLLARVLKMKCFPNCDLLSACPRKIWRFFRLEEYFFSSGKSKTRNNSRSYT